MTSQIKSTLNTSTAKPVEIFFIVWFIALKVFIKSFSGYLNLSSILKTSAKLIEPHVLIIILILLLSEKDVIQVHVYKLVVWTQ